MYRIKIESFIEKLEGDYVKESNRSTVYEQVIEDLDVQQLAKYLNSNPDVAS